MVAFRAPELARAIRPGQFVMIRAAAGRHAAAAEAVLGLRARARAGRRARRVLDSQQAGRRRQPAALRTRAPGSRLSCLGPLGRPFSPPPAGSEAWMVAGGTGLAPFATLSEDLADAGIAGRLFYGARTGVGTLLRRSIRSEGRRRGAGHRRRLAGRTGPGDGAAGARTRGPSVRAAGDALRVRAGGDARARSPRCAARHGRACEVATERQMGCGMGGCYSCVVRVRTPDGGTRYVRSCVEGPVFAAADIVWDDRRP